MEGCYGRHGVPTIWAFCGVRGATPAHVLFEVGGALVSRAVFRVLLGRFSKKKQKNTHTSKRIINTPLVINHPCSALGFTKAEPREGDNLHWGVNNKQKYTV